MSELLCLPAGTRSATPTGAAAVETPGDLVQVSDGRASPVRWLGRQIVSLRFADPLRVLPIRIRAGAGRGAAGPRPAAVARPRAVHRRRADPGRRAGERHLRRARDENAGGVHLTIMWNSPSPRCCRAKAWQPRRSLIMSNARRSTTGPSVPPWPVPIVEMGFPARQSPAAGAGLDPRPPRGAPPGTALMLAARGANGDRVIVSLTGAMAHRAARQERICPKRSPPPAS